MLMIIGCATLITGISLYAYFKEAFYLMVAALGFALQMLAATCVNIILHELETMHEEK